MVPLPPKAGLSRVPPGQPERSTRGVNHELGIVIPKKNCAWCVARQTILEFNISKISNSVSLSMMTGRGGVSVRFGNLLGAEGSNMEMWKMGWMPCMELGRWMVKETEPT